MPNVNVRAMGSGGCLIRIVSGFLESRFVPHLLLAFRVRLTGPIVLCWPSCRSKSSIAWELSLFAGGKHRRL